MVTERTAGWYWHCHHDVLLEYVWDVKERENYIHTHKPREEQVRRDALFKPVRGKLPAAYIKARVAIEQAWAAYNKDSVPGSRDYVAYEQAYDAYTKVKAAYWPAIEELHRRECPHCWWDGRTIFPTAVGE